MRLKIENSKSKMLFLKKMKGIFAAPPCIRQKACISLLLLVTWLSSRSKSRFFHCLIAQKRNVLTFVFSEGYLHHHLQLPPNLFIQKNQWMHHPQLPQQILSIYLSICLWKGFGCRHITFTQWNFSRQNIKMKKI